MLPENQRRGQACRAPCQLSYGSVSLAQRTQMLFGGSMSSVLFAALSCIVVGDPSRSEGFSPVRQSAF